MIGQTFSHYKILSKLGEGGMGEVYLAEDTELGRKVAVKVLPVGDEESPDLVERFRREARAVAALDHPNIVTVFNVEEAGGKRLLMMELIDGSSLHSLIPADGLPMSKVFEIAIPIADALAAAHDKGITHRDLKPANVMVTRDGRVKVLDFGLAKLDDSSAGTDENTETEIAPLTVAGDVIGTRPYMSPEQLQGRPIDSRSDIFSFGIVLYEMVTGNRPFQGASSIEIASSILKDAPSAVSETHADLPRQLDRIIHHCLAKDPERRFQSVKDVRNELETLQEEMHTGSVATGSQPAMPASPTEFPPTEVQTGKVTARGPAPGTSVPAAPQSARRRTLAIGALVLAIVATWWLGQREGAVAPEPQQVEPAVYNLVLQGRYLADKLGEDDLSRAAALYEQALDLDPNYALAWASLAESYSRRAAHGYVPVDKGYAKAREAAERALAIDDTLAESWATLGRVRRAYDWDWRGADEAFSRALQLDPGNIEVVRGAASLAANLGRLDQAVELSQQAVDSDPLSVSSYRNLGLYSYFAGRLDRARAALEKALELSPELNVAHSLLGRTYLAWSQAERAIEEFESEPHPAFHPFGTALGYHALGRQEEAGAALAELVETWGASAAYQIAEVHAFRGELDPAFEWLERAYAERDPGVAESMVDPLLISLHDDPRWPAFLRKIRLTD